MSALVPQICNNNVMLTTCPTRCYITIFTQTQILNHYNDKRMFCKTIQNILLIISFIYPPHIVGQWLAYDIHGGGGGVITNVR